MATFVYGNARYLLGTAQLNLLTAPVNAMLVTSDYVPRSQADINVTAIPSFSIIARDQALTNIVLSPGGLYSAVVPTFNALLSPRSVAAVVLYVKGVDDAHSPLLYYSSDGAGFPFIPQGFNYAVVEDQGVGGWFQA